MNASPNLPAWADKLIEAFELGDKHSPTEVFEKADAVANRLAPNTRRLRTLLLCLQGMAVLAPLFWLLEFRHSLGLSQTAYAVVLCTLLLVATCWWLRWRGMQHTWARARVVAEIARSEQSTECASPQATVKALAGAPALQAVAGWILATQGEQLPALAERKQRYLQARVLDQINYYREKFHEAKKQRHAISRVVTLSLDGALFLAAAGLAISFRDEPDRWLRWSGSDYVLGFIGTALPLLAVLAQLRGSFLELDCRLGRYTQQIEFLQTAVHKLQAEQTDDSFEETVADVERALLGEVVEWFYQTEQGESYYRSRLDDLDQRLVAYVTVTHEKGLNRLWSGLAASSSFLGRVIFGRVLIVSISILVTTVLINYKRAPEDPAIHASLRVEDGRLLSAADDAGYMLWDPKPQRTEHGLILVAHGLRDGVDVTGGDGHWMTLMDHTLQEALAPTVPEIVLVDWQYSSQPSNDPIAGMVGTPIINLSSLPGEVSTMLNDLSIIRAQAERIGELVGFKLARQIRNETLRRDRPMHFIGHSAGGFVVSKAVRVLIELGLEPIDMHVTLLDTPMPRHSDIAFIANRYPVDYYATSQFARMVPGNGFAAQFSSFSVEPPSDVDPYAGAHSFAYHWYIDTIAKDALDLGFGRSPFSDIDKTH